MRQTARRKNGRYGVFYGCKGYPKCSYSESIKK
nr:topoisomerase DNA-binding C4 zinc finger domain-containing protein [Niallia circulans]